MKRNIAIKASFHPAFHGEGSPGAIRSMRRGPGLSFTGEARKEEGARAKGGQVPIHCAKNEPMAGPSGFEGPGPAESERLAPGMWATRTAPASLAGEGGRGSDNPSPSRATMPRI